MSGVLASVPEPHQSPRPAPSRGLFRESHCNNLNIDCGTDSTADVSACACNAGYYGTGRACLPCRACPANASLVTPCPAGAAADVSVCACNVGFYGDGTVCLPCAAEVRRRPLQSGRRRAPLIRQGPPPQVWLLDTCAGASIPLINATLGPPPAVGGWCVVASPASDVSPRPCPLVPRGPRSSGGRGAPARCFSASQAWTRPPR